MNSPRAFRSKIDWWLILLLLSIPGIPMAMQWRAGSLPSSFWTAVVVAALVVVAFFPIRYAIEGETVSVQCGLIRWEYTAFHVQEVQSVRPTYDILASPALSLERLSVDLGFRGTVLISPKDKRGFLRALNALDPRLRPVHDSLVRGGASA